MCGTVTQRRDEVIKQQTSGIKICDNLSKNETYGNEKWMLKPVSHDAGNNVNA